MVKIGDVVTYLGADAYVTKVHSEKMVDLIQNGVTSTSVTNFTVKTVADQPVSSISSAISKPDKDRLSLSISDMGAAAPGSQRNTSQADSDDLDNNTIPAPGTGDTGAGLATDGRGRQKLKEKVTDHTSNIEDVNADVAKKKAASDKEKGLTSPSTAIGATGVKGADASAGVPQHVRDKMNETVKVRRLHGEEEILVEATRGSLKIIDRNGRKLEVGNIVHLPVRIVGVYSASDVEVVYPPHVAVTDDAEAASKQQTVHVNSSQIERF